MPRFIIKPDPGNDEYVVWSTIVDMPATAHSRPAQMDEETAARYDRADATGTSAQWAGCEGGQPFSWQHTEFNIGWPYGDDAPDEHDYVVKRTDLPELARRSEAGEDYNDLIRFDPWEN